MTALIEESTDHLFEPNACLIDGCTRPRAKNGKGRFCPTHYRQRREGKPITTTPRTFQDSRELADEVMFLLGTRSTAQIATALGYTDTAGITIALRRGGHTDMLHRWQKHCTADAERARLHSAICLCDDCSERRYESAAKSGRWK